MGRLPKLIGNRADNVRIRISTDLSLNGTGNNKPLVSLHYSGELQETKGAVEMGRILTFIGLTYLVCAFVEASPNPDAWSAVARAFLLVIAMAVVGMNAEAVLLRRSGPRTPRLRLPRRKLHAAG